MALAVNRNIGWQMVIQLWKSVLRLITVTTMILTSWEYIEMVWFYTYDKADCNIVA
jgi:hypothetical protein